MSFLQPFLLMAMPLMFIPIVIHLLNQRRHETVAWGAMQFLLAAKRLNTGIARLKNWIILALRTLIIAFIILALSRPIATGWIGGLGTSNRPVLLILDTSPSMELSALKGRNSKREAGLSRFQSYLETTRHSARRFLLASGMERPLELGGQDRFNELDGAMATAATSSIPQMLSQSIHFLEMEGVGAADIWICSDAQESDWAPRDGAWERIAKQLDRSPQLRVVAMSFPDRSELNFAVSIDRIELESRNEEHTIVLDVRIAQTSGSFKSVRLPLQLSVGDYEQRLDVVVDRPEVFISGIRMPVQSREALISGGVTIPQDANPMDNSYYFVNRSIAPRKILIFTEKTPIGELIYDALQTSSDESDIRSISRFSPETIGQLHSSKSLSKHWDLVVWQGDIPDAEIAMALRVYVEKGGVICWMPSLDWNSKMNPAFKVGDEIADTNGIIANSLGNRRWGTPFDFDEPQATKFWLSASDLFGNTESGESIPVQEIKLSKFVPILEDHGASSEQSFALASLSDKLHWLERVNSGMGMIYYLHTLPDTSFSNLEEQGICFYVAMQRLLEGGNESQRSGMQTAGKVVVPDLDQWDAVTPHSKSVLPWQRHLQSGVYESNDQRIAINRSIAEDREGTIAEESLSKIIPGHSIDSIYESRNGDSDLASEIGRLFVLGMLSFLLIEGGMSLPTLWNKSRPLAGPVRSKFAEVTVNSTMSPWYQDAVGNPINSRNAAGQIDSMESRERQRNSLGGGRP